MVEKNLQNTFEYVKAQLFPRWDSAHQWKCRKIETWRQRDGVCLHSRRTILIDTNIGELEARIVHEICHAICSNNYHSQPWRDRMLKANLRASEIGMGKTSEAIGLEINRLKHATDPDDWMVYARVSSIVAVSVCVPSFKSVAQKICIPMGLRKCELVQRYRRIKSIYANAVLRRCCGTTMGGLRFNR